jgi:hypothetical protein
VKIPFITYLKIFVFSILLSLISYSSSRAQEMLGISNSNFAGNMGMGMNPSLFIGSPYLYEINAISGDLFVDNDYVYLKRRSSLLIKSLQGESVPEERVLDYYDSRTKNAFGNVNLRGPAYIENRDKFSWGIHKALRANVSATNVPFHVAKFIKDGFDYSPQHDIRYKSTPFRAAALVWGELGGTYGRVLFEERNKKYLAGAVTLKLIAGFDGLYVDLSEYDYTVPSSDTLVVHNATGTYAHAMADKQPGFANPLAFRGYGAAIDLGVTYYRGKVHGAGDCNRTAENLKKYKYRLGFSLVDVGLVMFRQQSKVFSFENASMVWPGINNVDFNTMYEVDTAISNHFFGDPNSSQTDDKFNVWLPTALSAQFDYCIMPRIYANATVVAGVRLSKVAVVRPGQVAVSARYETRAFELAVPLTFYQFTTPHLGLAMRYRFFVLGTDRLGSYTGLWDTTGYDLYFGIKFNLCQKGDRRSKDPYCPVN